MTYASPFTSYSGINRDFLEVNPEVPYRMWMRAFGATPSNPTYYSYGKGLYDYYQNDYYGKASKDPGLKWLDYLDQLGTSGGLDRMWNALAPRQRGERPGQFAPPVKWVS